MAVINVGRSCLEKEVKETLTAMVEKDPKMGFGLIEYLIPDCATVPARAVQEAKRAMPAMWGVQVTYIDGKGNEKEFDSPSALLKVLGITTSGIQCDPEGTRCHSTSQIDSLKIKGYTVWGNGEGTEPEKGISKHLTVLHPDYVASMAKKEKAQRKAK